MHCSSVSCVIAKSRRSRWAAAAAVIVGTATFLSLGNVEAGGRAAAASHRAQGMGASAIAGSKSRFEFLAGQSSNSCTLDPVVLERMPSTMRLQGSCCSPMNLSAYRMQVKGLLAYQRVWQIPRDPYDIPVVLAKRLLAYDRALSLSVAQARVYERAMRSSREQGPCCCHCWRWDAFRGLSKYLIIERGWRAHAIATVIDLLDGCGGPAG